MPPAHILIVEPHAAEVQGLARSLAHEHRVSILASAAAAWELLGAAHPPDLLVLDVDDRSGAGFELARMLRDERRYARLPVVLTSARLDPQIESLGLQLGAAEVLGKPLQVEITRLRLNALLERTRLALALDRSLSAGGLALWEGTTRQCRFTEGASELLGWDQGQQFDWRELAHPQDLLKLEAALARVLMSEPPRPPMDGARAGARAGPAAGHWATTAPAPDQLVLDLRLRHRGGGWRWVALQGRLLAEDLPGSDATAPSATDTAAGRLAGTLLDIGRRKQLEAALREREAGLSALMGSLHDLVMVVDANGRVMSCHLPAEFELALPEPPWLGRSYEELLPAGIAGPLHEALAGLALDGRRRSFECDWPAPGQSPDDAADTGAAPAATQGADEAQSGGRLRHGLA
ncbi:MAG: hypothetical protein RL722_712, partial [Pseudomonadota bacterium]